MAPPDPLDRSPAGAAHPQADAAEPIYNIKVVVQRTGIPADTVRAWERRYGIPHPARTPGGQRIYSERDIAAIRWLRQRTEEGMAISQAASLLDALGLEQALAPTGAAPTGPRTHAAVVRDLLAAFLRYDQPAADAIIGEAFVLFGVEEAVSRVVRPALVEIGELWHRGEIAVTTEHFASQFVKRKIAALLGAYENPRAPWTVIVGCAPHERHEIGALVLCLFMVRQGWHVLYLGPDVPISDLTQTVARVQPDMVCISASSAESAEQVARIGAALQEGEGPGPLFVYGGNVFNNRPELRARVPGVFLAEDARQATEAARALLTARSTAPSTPRPRSDRRV